MLNINIFSIKSFIKNNIIMSGKKRQTKKKYNYQKEDKKSIEKLSKKKKRKNKKYTKKNLDNYLQENNLSFEINLKINKIMNEVIE